MVKNLVYLTLLLHSVSLIISSESFSASCLDLYQAHSRKFENEIALMKELENYKNLNYFQVAKAVIKSGSTDHLKAVKDFYNSYRKRYRASRDQNEDLKPYQYKEALL